MSLNIKSDTVHELARELAAVTGTSMTSAVEDALRHRLAELRPRPRSERMLPLLEEIWARVTDEDREATRQFMADMYDEDGLPR